MPFRLLLSQFEVFITIVFIATNGPLLLFLTADNIRYIFISMPSRILYPSFFYTAPNVFIKKSDDAPGSDRILYLTICAKITNNNRHEESI